MLVNVVADVCKIIQLHVLVCSVGNSNECVQNYNTICSKLVFEQANVFEQTSIYCVLIFVLFHF